MSPYQFSSPDMHCKSSVELIVGVGGVWRKCFPFVRTRRLITVQTGESHWPSFSPPFLTSPSSHLPLL